ncbi:MULTISPECIES: aminodeoxychorismate/anthranilate synthase [Lawsonella]|uniref:aminodeoxychorismate/anthranilate synthase n=1 Tax=Lawsonella TaxID=1847725 RepID=UPI0025BDC044|nr:MULTISPECIES: aminodeoxychorismate/anthranilate synthase [Lawsonella]
MRILLVDHHDSYTHILSHLFYSAGQQLGYAIDVDIVPHDCPSWQAARIEELAQYQPAQYQLAQYQLIVLSPGPGSPLVPEDVGVSRCLLHSQVPVFGVCLGHQLMAVVEGAQLQEGHGPHHGVVSHVRHNGDGIWHSIEQNAQVVRYHSLAIAEPLPTGIEATSWAEDGTVMSLQYQAQRCQCAGAPRWGVQFHPESIDSPCGVQIVMNVLRLTQEWWDRNGSGNGNGSDNASGYNDGGCSIRESVSVEGVAPAESIARAKGVETVGGVTAEQIAAVFREEVQAGESLRWLDDSLGETASLIAICGEPQKSGQKLGLPDIQPIQPMRPIQPMQQSSPAYPYAGWIGVVDYEDDYTNFAHTEVVAWGRRNCWQLAGADPARVTVLCERLHDCVGSSQVDDMAEAATAVPSTETPTILGTERVAAVAVSPARYKKSFTTCQNLLRRGESYEICLTDTIRLPRRLTRHPWEAYQQLRHICPTNFGAYLEFPTGPVEAIASASLELFLHVSKDGRVTTRPMKGTAPRCLDDPAEDKRRAFALQTDPKTRAENLMVIDMARSDVARVCRPGSVTVPKDRVVETYRTVHQLVTEITGTLLPGFTVCDALRACFPPASMTGAPKERTVELLKDIEAQPRGVYSGILGFLGDDGSASFSVIIRTASYMRSGDVLIGAGGAITADSSCHAEYEEMLHKANYVVGTVVDPAQWTMPVVDSFYLVDGMFAQAENLTARIGQMWGNAGTVFPYANGDERRGSDAGQNSSDAARWDKRLRELHQQRFVSSVEAMYGVEAATQAADFYQDCLAHLPTEGEFFPQIRWGGTSADTIQAAAAQADAIQATHTSTAQVTATQAGSADLFRPCPPRLTEIVGIVGTDPVFKETYAKLVTPRIKGPDMPAYGKLRSLAMEGGAHEVVLVDRWGMVREGSHSAILWWDGDVLCAPLQDAVMPSTMRTVVEEAAHRQGFRVEERWLPADELQNYRVWSVNALHGIREITSWI